MLKQEVKPTMIVKETEEVEVENKAKFEKFMHDLLMDAPNDQPSSEQKQSK